MNASIPACTPSQLYARRASYHWTPLQPIGEEEDAADSLKVSGQHACSSSAGASISSEHTDRQVLQRSVTTSTPHRRFRYDKPLPPLPVTQPAARPRHSSPPSSPWSTPPRGSSLWRRASKKDNQRQGRATLASAELEYGSEPALMFGALDPAANTPEPATNPPPFSLVARLQNQARAAITKDFSLSAAEAGAFTVSLTEGNGIHAQDFQRVPLKG